MQARLSHDAGNRMEPVLAVTDLLPDTGAIAQPANLKHADVPWLNRDSALRNANYIRPVVNLSSKRGLLEVRLARASVHRMPWRCAGIDLCGRVA